MEEETTVAPTSEEETTEETTEETSEEEVDWRTEAQKAKELADNYKRRAEKAERKAKEAPKPKEDEGSLSHTDLIYLAKADIHEEDISYVTDYAKRFGISVKEAHAQTTPILAHRQEERTTAQATSTKSARGVKPKTGEDYLRKAEETGEVPTSDKDLQELILARQNRFRQK